MNIFYNVIDFYDKSWIFSIITPVFSVTWSSEIIIIYWFAAQETCLITNAGKDVLVHIIRSLKRAWHFCKWSFSLLSAVVYTCVCRCGCTCGMHGYWIVISTGIQVNSKQLEFWWKNLCTKVQKMLTWAFSDACFPHRYLSAALTANSRMNTFH